MRAWEQFGNRGTGPWGDTLMTSSPRIIPSPQMNADYDQIKLVAQLKPDLILETDLHGDPERYRGLARIAPVISAPKGTGEFYSSTLQDQTLRVAQAMGVPEQGQQLVDSLKARIASVPTEHPEFAGKSISLLSKYETKWMGQINDIERLKFFLDLGFRQNPAFLALAEKTKLDPDAIELPPKDFRAVDADLVVVDATWTSSGIDPATDPSSAETLSKNARFASLPATRDGRSFIFVANPDRPYWEALDRPSVLAVSWLLDNLVPEIAEKLK